MKPSIEAGRRWLQAQPPAVVAALALGLVLLVAIADQLTGRDAAFRIFYLAPVALVAWFGEWRLGWVAAAAATVASMVVNRPEDGSLGGLVLWNGAVELGVFLAVAALVSALRDARASQGRQARTDDLTGLINRRTFMQVVRTELERSARYGRPLTLACADLDGFQQVNEQLGYVVGDTLLQLVAATLRRNVRASDAVARLGGDEFALLLPETDLDGARTLMEKLRQEVRELMQRRDWPSGMSIGAVALATPAPGVTAEDLIKRAEGLLAQSQRAGRDSLHLEPYA